MNNIKFTLYHPTIDLLSDRTFRFLLKKISTLIRDIQTHEVLYLVNQDCSLSPSEKQSMRDRLKESLKHIPATYYIEKINKGSLEILVFVSLYALWLLNQTVAQSVKEAWLKTKFHQNTVKYLSSDLRQIFIKQEAGNVIKNANLGRFYVEEHKQEIDKNGDIIIVISIKTSDKVEEHIEMVKYDVDYVMNDAKKQIADTKNEERKAT